MTCARARMVLGVPRVGSSYPHGAAHTVRHGERARAPMGSGSGRYVNSGTRAVATVLMAAALTGAGWGGDEPASRAVPPHHFRKGSLLAAPAPPTHRDRPPALAAVWQGAWRHQHPPARRPPVADPHAGNTPWRGPAALRGAPHRVLRLINRVRAEADCPPVRENPALSRAAQSHSDHMAGVQALSHTGSTGTDPGSRLTDQGYRWSRAGENIARGQRGPGAVVRAWRKSHKHHTILVTCAFRDAGVGVQGGRHGPWWTAVFAARR
ncbi:CAP domain-containing protein [Streptomyces sp. NPDC017993]|uniref:CAP domain-containing protein n=1 Tax=Streptomyces sp. NPDC017993 TaxID=3365027 RepID=UPI0037900E6B